MGSAPYRIQPTELYFFRKLIKLLFLTADYPIIELAVLNSAALLLLTNWGRRKISHTDKI